MQPDHLVRLGLFQGFRVSWLVLPEQSCALASLLF
jgi:hypothetical protein